MKHRRAWISLFTACALLAQTFAWALPMNPMKPMSLDPAPAQDQVLPCHEGAAAGVIEKASESAALAPDAAQDQAPAKCCGDETCNHTALCGGGFALASSAALTAWIPAAGSAVAAVVATAIPPYTLTPLRPPIASQN